jgi:alkylhydroperoxidase/carboxymuconolactone decarboxylase family protein YurZ
MNPSKAILRKMRKKRGYLLDYHRLLGNLDPELLATYDAFYTQMTLVDRVLGRVEKETIWIALIVATRARIGTLHMRRAVEAGMSKDAIADAVALAAACESLDAQLFSQEAFPDWVGSDTSLKKYLKTFEAARGKVPPYLAEVAAVIAHAGARRPAGMRIHLVRAFKAGAKREQIAEGLSFALLHCGGPTMVQAVQCWVETAKRKRIPAPF